MSSVSFRQRTVLESMCLVTRSQMVERVQLFLICLHTWCAHHDVEVLRVLDSAAGLFPLRCLDGLLRHVEGLVCVAHLGVCFCAGV